MNHALLDGRVALITGAAKRVGANIARTLHDSGANIVLHFRHASKEAHTLKDELNELRADSAVLIQCDLLQFRKLPTLIHQARGAWDRIDILVNNASSFYPTPLADTTEEQWDELLGSNLKAPYFLCQSAAADLTRTRGCIINITDIHADRPLKGFNAYCIAKAGLAMMTKALARELGPDVRVNGIAPGAVLWPEAGLDDVTRQRIMSRTALKKTGEPEDIARTVLFLASDASYITGQIITVDGGRTLSN